MFQEDVEQRELDGAQMLQVAEEIVSIYKSAHSSYPLISIDSIRVKIQRWWRKLLYLQKSSGDRPSSARTKFLAQMNELFEVLVCRCKMKLAEAGKVELQCQCTLANKIPTMELEFVYAQRYRGDKPPALRIGPVDVAVTNQLEQTAARKALKV